MGDQAFFFRRQPLPSCCRCLKIKARGTASQTQRATSRQRQDANLFQYRRTIRWTRGHKFVEQILLQTRTSNDIFFCACTALSLNFYGNLLLTTTCMSFLQQRHVPHPRHSERLLHKSKVTWATSKPTNSLLRQEQDVNLFLFRRTILGKRKSTPSARVLP